MLRLVVLLALAAAAPVRAQTIANPYSDQLARLYDIPRRAALRRAILDSGERCRTVDRGGRQGQYRNLAYWRARCTSGEDYAVFIGPDGSVQVRPCGDLAGLKLPLCRPWRGSNLLNLRSP